MQGTTPTLLVVRAGKRQDTARRPALSNTRDPASSRLRHTIQFTIGDYELTRKIQAEKGKTYTGPC
jgi:hypothetical protein